MTPELSLFSIIQLKERMRMRSNFKQSTLRFGYLKRPSTYAETIRLLAFDQLTSLQNVHQDYLHLSQLPWTDEDHWRVMRHPVRLFHQKEHQVSAVLPENVQGVSMPESGSTVNYATSELGGRRHRRRIGLSNGETLRRWAHLNPATEQLNFSAKPRSFSGPPNGPREKYLQRKLHKLFQLKINVSRFDSISENTFPDARVTHHQDFIK